MSQQSPDFAPPPGRAPPVEAATPPAARTAARWLGYDWFKALVLLVLLLLLAGLGAGASAPQVAVVPTPVPTGVLPTPVLVVLPVLNSDTVLMAGQVLLSGRGQPGAQIELFVDGAARGVVAVGADGRWSQTITLAAGTFDVVVNQLNPDGTLQASGPVSITVGGAATATPAPTAIPAPTATSAPTAVLASARTAIPRAADAVVSTVRGNISANQPAYFRFDGTQGQLVIVRVEPFTATVRLRASGLADGQPLTGADGVQIWAGDLPATQAYAVDLIVPTGDPSSAYQLDILYPERVSSQPGFGEARGMFAAAGARRAYIVRLTSGRAFSASVDGPGILRIIGVADGAQLVSFDASAVTWGGVVPNDQAYLIEVQSRGAGEIVLTTQVR